MREKHAITQEEKRRTIYSVKFSNGLRAFFKFRGDIGAKDVIYISSEPLPEALAAITDLLDGRSEKLVAF